MTVATDADVTALLLAVEHDPGRRLELVPLLHEGHALYDGLGERRAAHVRGTVMAAFATVGLPEAALPAVVEALLTADDAFTLAAAARASRGVTVPSRELTGALVTAVERFQRRDDAVSFPTPGSAADVRPTTAITEVLLTLESFGPAAHTTHAALTNLQARHAARWSPALRRRLTAATAAVARAPLLDLVVAAPTAAVAEQVVPATPLAPDSLRIPTEDQAGTRSTLGAELAGVPHIVAFFYTRCTNPRKCSATVTRLGVLQSLLEATGYQDDIGVLAITYDPGYDRPDRMRAYGEARGLRFTDHVKLIRTRPGPDRIRAAFDLKVGYAGSVVNQHASELLLVDIEPAVRLRWLRSEWSADEVNSAVVQAVL